ncbi:MAG: Flp pilus assembly protein CpaB, partial [Myxococcales bacterium]|nr:Flp pilus assembly protein CpaB [Myxococcales bacterium]
EREVPVSYVEPRAVRAAELSKVKGLRAGHDLDPQDSLLWTDLAIDVEQRDLSTLVQPGFRALTIEARRTAMIRPGDYVDVIANFSESAVGERAGASVVLLQRVVVLAVGEETDRQAFSAEGKGSGAFRRRSATLTLSVQLQEAQLLTLAARQGALSVVLRDYTDPSVFDDLPRVTVRNLVEQAARANDRRAARYANRVPTRITGQGGR